MIGLWLLVLKDISCVKDVIKLVHSVHFIYISVHCLLHQLKEQY